LDLLVGITQMQLRAIKKPRALLFFFLLWLCSGFSILAFGLGSRSEPVAGNSVNAETAIAESLSLKVDLGQYQDALSQLDALTQEEKSKPEITFLAARLFIATGRLPLAKESLAQYVRLRPTDEHPYLLLGLINGREGKFKDAILMFGKAIAVNPRSAKAYSDRGVAKGAMGNVKESIKDFDKAIALDPRYADAYRNRGIARESLKDFSAACTDWRVAAALGQDDPARWVKQQCK
jgi:tetratricopeptide (TPR) repeat protein